ncbi:hypothetical protein BCE02nite_42680 [Brevibacillus centrosporus]|nr:hypothetical protein BCE02nite_42680 [Brevibacillus centrosporus]
MLDVEGIDLQDERAVQKEQNRMSAKQIVQQGRNVIGFMRLRKWEDIEWISSVRSLKGQKKSFRTAQPYLPSCPEKKRE